MSSRRRDLDEDDVRVRPGKHKARARSKQRPAHDAALAGMVIAVDRGRFTVILDGDEASSVDREVYAIKARELGRKGIVVGDRVELVGDSSGGGDALARIIRRNPRTTSLRRSADDNDPDERIVVANAGQLAIVVAVSTPEPRPRFIDRALIAAYDGGLSPLLIVTKTDLGDPAPLLARYLPLGLPYIATQIGEPPEALAQILADQVTVLIGHSGVGKSTLVNSLVPEAVRLVGHVNAVTGRGRHTSTSAVALPLANGGWVIDTPGIRSFGLAHVDLDRFIQAFPDLAMGARGCPRGCTHDDEHCALDAFVQSGGGDPTRLASLRGLLASRAGAE